MMEQQANLARVLWQNTRPLILPVAISAFIFIRLHKLAIFLIPFGFIPVSFLPFGSYLISLPSPFSDLLMANTLAALYLIGICILGSIIFYICNRRRSTKKEAILYTFFILIIVATTLFFYDYVTISYICSGSGIPSMTTCLSKLGWQRLLLPHILLWGATCIIGYFTFKSYTRAIEEIMVRIFPSPSR